MRLVTFESERGPRLGAVAGDRVVDLAEASNGALPANMVAFIEAGPSALDEARSLVERGTSSGVPFGQVKLLAPIPRPRRNVICLGLNYRDHAIEIARSAGQEPKMPEHPVFFTKPPTAVIGPDEAIEYDPAVSEQIDWEVEFTFVIGPGGRDIPAEQAMEHVFGYTVANDVSARDLQMRHGGQYFKGKSLDTFCPIGPWIVTADEIPDPHNLPVVLRVNGVEKQRSSTRELIFAVPSMIATLSAGLTLEAGDVILTGTPHGVGFARTPPEWLKDGDVVECEVEKIGVLRNPVRMRRRA
ncbi:MAG: fumarylacetoacetate hydrolase family protein [Chloroflexota bacterium]|nr:fumarylacetoacetate hydrolase family protein [Chloroflexota bacterium]